MPQIRDYDLFNPTDEHRMLREMVRGFAGKELEPVALANDRAERFDLDRLDCSCRLSCGSVPRWI